MSFRRKSLPGNTIRRWLARAVSPGAMESVFDPFLADVQADWCESVSNRSAFYTRWRLCCAYASLGVQVAVFAIGSIFGSTHELAPAVHAGSPRVDVGPPADRTPRYAAPLGLAALITFGLFVLMSALIAGDPGAVIPVESISVSLTHVPVQPKPIPEPEDTLPKIREVVPPPPNTGLPTGEWTQKPTVLPPGPGEIPIGPISPHVTGPDTRIHGADQPARPKVRVAPVYPRRALDRGIEGWVEVEFTVTEAGSVSEPTIVQSHPSAIFDKAALRAIEGWKYEPKVVDGRPVASPGVRNRLRFEISGRGSGSD